MNALPIVKYTSYGNNFVIVDETQDTLLSECEKSLFAYQATNINYGVGSDNFLLVQTCSSDVLEDINRARGYWKSVPESAQADYVFRMFEPDGAEAFSCANGLMSVASYLNHRYKVESARIMTEIPTHSPKVVHIGSNPADGSSWANIGFPRRIPAPIADHSLTTGYDDNIDMIDEIEIAFRKHDLEPFSQGRSLTIDGYLVFTGEPHLVVFVESGFSLPDLGRMAFISSGRDGLESALSAGKDEKRVAFGTWLIDHIGNYLNRKYAHIFPSGINVNFVQQRQHNRELEYRCFERGIYRETLACGTGALAVAAVSRKLGLISGQKMTIWPHRCRWHQPAAQMVVTEDVDGWTISGAPYPLIEGVFVAAARPGDTKTDPELETLMSQLTARSGIQPLMDADTTVVRR